MTRRVTATHVELGIEVTDVCPLCADERSVIPVVALSSEGVYPLGALHDCGCVLPVFRCGICPAVVEYDSAAIYVHLANVHG